MLAFLMLPHPCLHLRTRHLTSQAEANPANLCPALPIAPSDSDERIAQDDVSIFQHHLETVLSWSHQQPGQYSRGL